MLWRSGRRYSKRLYLNVCLECNACFTSASTLAAHRCDVKNVPRLTFPSGVFETPLNVFRKLERESGVRIARKLRFYRFRMTYDIELLLSKEQLWENAGAVIEFLSRHELLSLSACSDVPGFKTPRCFVTEGDAVECIGRFVDHANRVAEETKKIVRKNFE